MRYAEVAVNHPLTQPRTFTYSIPPHLSVRPGHAVWVPFGSRVIQGIVLAVADHATVEETKDISEVIDARPVLLPHQIELCRRISEYYLSSYFDSASLMLPPGFERRVVAFIEPGPDAEAANTSLTVPQQGLLEILRKSGRISVKELKKSAAIPGLESLIEQLVRRKLAVKTHELERVKVSPRLETYVRLATSIEQAKALIPTLEQKRASQQAKLLGLLVENPEIALSAARKQIKATSSAVRSLERQGLVSVEKVRVQRDPLADRTFSTSEPPALTPDQTQVWAQIGDEIERLSGGEPPPHAPPSVFLLHGVTCSGKTEIYLRALDKVVSLGKRGIVLVPEIALTPQTIRRFASRFPDRVAVLHSRLSLGERFDVWQRIREGEFDVVIGSRGAIFAPQPDLGLIVIDEEHEWTYKQQEQPPRYHTRDVAEWLASLTGSVVILGSATPDVTSYHRARLGEFKLLQLRERISAGATSPMPEVEIVDLRRELREGNRSIFSRSLAQALGETLAAGEQAILFLNRRGSATFVQCRDCGHVLNCRRCDASMTYHADESDLVCHRCNYRTAIPRVCPICNSTRIKFLGAGTQRVEEEVERAFPAARVLRWDRDVTKSKDSHEHILERFLAHEADVLVGTQMIAKGLDMPLVTLVGVINADVGLYLPDFRSSERTFQILAQVAGRAGRREAVGKVVIQSYAPEHYAITAAAQHDYESFYSQEISFRRQHDDPPFSRITRLVYTGSNAAVSQREAERVRSLIDQEKARLGLPDVAVFGASPAFVQRVRGRYRWQIVIRSEDPLPLLSELHLPRGWSADIDAVSLA